ncbi:MAG: Bax inhibitor-1/YccA family protein [Chloroherpetonaceae bacterium]|nr:Bax inhibitor-1/YccA family protein [Chloroherpetonaceae bacterium]
MENTGFAYREVSSASSLVSIEKRVINQVFFWMMLGLLFTAGTAWWAAGTESVRNIVFGNRLVFWGLIIAELGLVFAISGLINRISSMAAAGLFFLYSGLNGLTLSSIFLVYNLGSIAGVFLITAGMFGAMAVFGATTKMDLSKIGALLFMALIGMVIAGLVNIFLGSSMLSMIISAIGVVVFTGLTAYDMQRIKEMASAALDGESEGKIAVMGALSMYLNFINLFLSLLQLFGGRNDE